MLSQIKIHMFATEYDNLKLKCNDCGHITYRHLRRSHSGQDKLTVKCWYCKHTVWVITVLEMR